MELPKSIVDMREVDPELEAASLPNGMDARTLAESVWRHILLFGHGESADRDSLELLRVVRAAGRVCGLWSYRVGGATHFALSVFGETHRYIHCYSNYDAHAYFGEKGLTVEQFAVWDAARFDERERILDVYRARAEAAPDRSKALWEFGLAVWYLNRLMYPGPLDDAVAPLARARALAPKNLRVCGLLGLIFLRLGRNEDALREFEAGAALDDADPTFVYYASLATLDSGDERAWKVLDREARTRAEVRRVNVTAFDNPATRHEERLMRAGESLRKRVEGISVPSDEALAERDRAAIRIPASEVPERFHDLIPLAKLWGVGDDTSRGYFVGRATKKDKSTLRAALTPHVAALNAWLDSFPRGELSDAASAFLYLLEAFEEMDV